MNRQILQPEVVWTCPTITYIAVQISCWTDSWLVLHLLSWAELLRGPSDRFKVQDYFYFDDSLSRAWRLRLCYNNTNYILKIFRFLPIHFNFLGTYLYILKIFRYLPIQFQNTSVDTYFVSITSPAQFRLELYQSSFLILFCELFLLLRKVKSNLRNIFSHFYSSKKVQFQI